ncbi:MAG: hypothetical protein E6J17_01965 [Chloroflexi bacterium]|nr:MAG: hypothetical protein E6J17_01965 [Chloroflexota bacterium]
MISAVATSIESWLATLTPIVRTLLVPTKYFWTTLTGMTTSSSVFWNVPVPFAAKMPLISNGRPPIWIVLPMELGSSPRSVAVVAPRTTTRSCFSTSRSETNDPAATSYARTVA